MADIIVEDVDIPVELDNIKLKGSIYYTSSTPPKAPWIIVIAGMLYHRGTKFVQFYARGFADAGYYVLSYDYRGHGESKKETGRFNYVKTTPKIFSDIHEVVSWILNTQSERLLNDKIALFGRSYGGALILTNGFIDERIKILIALCTRYDYSTITLKISQDLREKMSPKYFLKKDLSNNDRILIAHSRDDEQIPFENVTQIKNHLGLSEENVMIFDEGGHSFDGHREEIFERAIKFLKKL
jgi:esterase/lipase